MRVSVVALGKIGLPLAVQFAAKGHQVVGVDINPATVEQVNAGQEPFPGEAHLAELLAETVADGRLRGDHGLRGRHPRQRRGGTGRAAVRRREHR